MKTKNNLQIAFAVGIISIVAILTRSLQVLAKFDNIILPPGLESITVDKHHAIPLQAWQAPDGSVRVEYCK